MKQELKIAGMLVDELVKKLNEGEYSASKKLLNSYENVIYNYKHLNGKEVEINTFVYELLNKSKKLEEIKNRLTDKIIPSVLAEGNYLSIESLTSIVSRLIKIYNNINSDFSKFKNNKV